MDNTIDVIDTIHDVFRSLHGDARKPLFVRSPGRVNLIGEHTDYNQGFVLPAAIDLCIVFAIAENGKQEWGFYSADFAEAYNCDAGTITKSPQRWVNYLLGVLDQFRKLGVAIPGFDCVFGGNIPIGAGLSSSAAVEAGFAYALNELFGLKLDRLSLVKLAQRAENEFVGVNCGIMDQFANMFGKEKSVLRLDCRSLEYEYFPFEHDEVDIVICDTSVRRELPGSEYNVRRSQCDEGVAVIRQSYPDVISLRDVSAEMLDEHASALAPVVLQRCRYVLEENARVLQACAHLQHHRFESFGECMFASHHGLRDMYEVSCAELDTLVDIARHLPSVLGSRMMGAGFGGCTINLVERHALEAFTAIIKSEYHRRSGLHATVHVMHPGSGTRAE